MSSNISLRISLCASLLLISLASSFAFAQGVKATSSHSVLAAASAEQVRFTALGEVYQLRLEVFSTTGEKLFDSDFKPGNLLDWQLQDQQGQRLIQGAYRCVVTTKNLAGQTSLKRGELLLQADQVTFQAPGQEIQAANTLPTLGQSDLLTILGKESLLPLTLLAHDGEQGRVVSGRGGLSFRTGDFFAGKDVEQMRLTPEGKLGLGVSDPQAKLEVAGTIRTSEGIVFPDGSIQTTAYVASGRSLSERTRMQRDIGGRSLAEPDEKAETAKRLTPNISGMGTTNQITKWSDGPNGVVADSALSESGGNVGLGITTPDSMLHLAGPAGVNALTFNTPGTTRGRFGTIPNIPDWLGMFLNGKFSGSGWLLDNPARTGWFFKLDNRTAFDEFAVYKIPPGAGAHTDEFPRFVLRSSGGGALGTMPLGYVPAATLDVISDGTLDVLQWRGTAGGSVLGALKANGNVGIGTTTPGAKLDVAGTINTTTQYNLGGSRILSVPGTGNLILGIEAGEMNAGSFNTFIGRKAGINHTEGNSNTFIGIEAGESKDTIGTGFRNTLIGRQTGRLITSGSDNVFVGNAAGFDTLGPDSNTTGNYNTYVGTEALGLPALNNATAIGYRAKVTQSNSLVLGSINGINGATVSTNVGIGTTTPNFPLAFPDIVGDKISLYGQSGDHYGFGVQGSLFQIHTLGSSDDIAFGYGRSASFTETMRIKGNGRVGIGTTNPTKALLELNGVAVSTVGAGYFMGSGGVGSTGAGTYNLSLYANSNVAANSFVAFSDERIKRIHGRSDAAHDLATLAGIEVTDYSYIDTVARGTSQHKKVIAQQVEKVFPQAVNRSTDTVPDIYRQAEYKDGWVKLATNLKQGERVRLIGDKAEGVYEVLEATPDKFRTAFVPAGAAVFVYGREVKDFRTVDYEAIAMLNVSATQELHRLLQQKDSEIKAIKAEAATLKEQNASLQQRNAELDARLTALEQALQQLLGQQQGQSQPQKHQ